jgi:hypothetical protein
MSDRERYSLEADLEEAEIAARELPGQIARLREAVRKAKSVLSQDKISSGELGKE